jgi:hypothetical protein
MTRPSTDIEELLTGLIDDQLTAQERALVEKQLQTDESSQHLLASLKRNRVAVQAISLVTSPRFDQRVAELAAARAKEQGINAPWIVPSEVERSKVERRSKLHWFYEHRSIAAMAAAVAAILIGGTIYVQTKSNPKINSLVDNQAIQSIDPSVVDSNEPLKDISPTITESIANDVNDSSNRIEGSLNIDQGQAIVSNEVPVTDNVIAPSSIDASTPLVVTPKVDTVRWLRRMRSHLKRIRSQATLQSTRCRVS